MKKNKEKMHMLIFAIMVFAFMFMLNSMTPMVSDDFAHYYGMTGDHCTNIGEIIRDMEIFRETTNGRVFPHFFVYLFLALPKTVFNIVNAVMAAALLTVAGKYFEYKTLPIICAAFALWIFIPDFGQVFLWLTGSANYLWGLVLFLLFIFPYFSAYAKNRTKYCTALLSVLGFICGAWSENGATAAIFTCGMFGLLTWIKDRKFPFKLFVPFCFMILGYAFLMLAPATSGTRAGGDVMENIWYIRVCLKDYCIWLFAAYFILLIISFVLKTDKKIIVSTIILVSAGMVSILVFIFAVYLPARSFYILVTFLIVSCLMLICEIKAKAVLPAISVLLAVLFSFSAVTGIKDINNLYNQSKVRESILAEADGTVEIDAYKSATKYSAIFEEELSEDEENWYNDLVAKYYGVKAVKKSPAEGNIG